MSYSCQLKHSAQAFKRCGKLLMQPIRLIKFSAADVQEHGAKRLQVALTHSRDTSFLVNQVVPLLGLLGCDALCNGTCQQSLVQLLTTMYRVPGFLSCLHAALVEHLVVERDAVSAVGWFVLSVAAQVQLNACAGGVLIFWPVDQSTHGLHRGTKQTHASFRFDGMSL
jgi:hypothetical protein